MQYFVGCLGFGSADFTLVHFAASSDESVDVIWSKIVTALNGNLSAVICPNSSSFITTKDGLECLVRNARGDLLANCYSEDDRMGGRRWTINQVKD